MKKNTKTKKDLLMEVERLRAKLEDAEVEQKHARLASFPQLNPNPVVEVDLDGHIHYSNPSAEKLFPELKKAGRNHQWLADLEKIADVLEHGQKRMHTRELKVGEHWYQQTIHSVLEGTRLRIYGFDITERKRAEQECERLRGEAENERRRLEAVMEALPVGIALTDTKGGNIRANKTFEQIWGTPRPPTTSVADYGVYKAWWSETGGPVPPEEWASAQVLEKGQAVVNQLLEIQRFDGSLASVINSAAPIFDADGKIVECAVVIQDITDLRKAEEALRQSEERLRRVIETSQIGIGFGDSTGRIFEGNESFFRITGYSRKEILDGGIGWERLTAPEYADIDRLVMEQISATGVAGPYEKEYIRKGGSRIPILVSAARLSTEPDEHVAFIVDLTERKQMEEELRKSRGELEVRVQQRTAELAKANELLERVFSSIDISLAYMDRDFNFIRVNRAYAEADKREPEFYVGKNHFVLFPNKENEQIFKKVAETGEPYSVYAKPFEYAEHPERGVTHWDWSLQPIKDPDGSVGGVVLSLVNVTERIRAQEAVEAERQRFYDVLEMLPAYLVLLAPDHHVPFANGFFRERFGESHGQRCFEYLFGRSEPCEVCESYTPLKTMAPHEWEWTGPDGHHYNVFDFPFTDVDGSTLILEMGIDITEQKQTMEALRESEKRLRHLSSQLLTVQENERKRVAREIHDGIGQMLSAIKFKVEDITQKMRKDKDKTMLKPLETIIPLIRESIEEVRRIQMDLRPSTLDDLGISATIDWFCRIFRKIYSSIQIEYQIDIQEKEVPIELKTVIFRVIQEAMNNVSKHSKADLVNLSLKKIDNRIELAIKDNGAGFDLENSRRGYGLGSMEERTELSGGFFVIDSKRGEGTAIRASWPTG